MAEASAGSGITEKCGDVVRKRMREASEECEAMCLLSDDFSWLLSCAFPTVPVFFKSSLFFVFLFFSPFLLSIVLCILQQFFTDISSFTAVVFLAHTHPATLRIFW